MRYPNPSFLIVNNNPPSRNRHLTRRRSESFKRDQGIAAPQSRAYVSKTHAAISAGGL